MKIEQIIYKTYTNYVTPIYIYVYLLKMLEDVNK